MNLSAKTPRAMGVGDMVFTDGELMRGVAPHTGGFPFAQVHRCWQCSYLHPALCTYLYIASRHIARPGYRGKEETVG